jgi:predicted acetyltransferase
MTVTVKPSNLEDAYIFRNLQPLYQHDLSAFKNIPANRHGILEPENPDVCDLLQHGSGFDYWYNHSGILYPYLIWLDDIPVGFVLVSRAPWVIDDVDNELREFFVLHAYRGRGLAQIAAQQVFKMFLGRWGLRILPRNTPAIAFWKRTITDFAGSFREGQVEDQPTLYFQASNPT